MATLINEQGTFKPDIDLIRTQCGQIVQRNPSLKERIAAALGKFNEAIRCVDQQNFPPALERFVDLVQEVSGLGADELEATCLFYLASTAMTAREFEMGVRLMEGALHYTQNPWLTLSAYNQLMMHYLTTEDCDRVLSLADATMKVLGSLPPSTAGNYYQSAANYNAAEAHFRQSKFREVLQPIERAMAGFAAIAMQSETAKCQGMRGNARIQVGDLKGGLEDIESSLAVFRNLKVEGEISTLLHARGVTMIELGKRTEAIRDLREALVLLKKQGDSKAINSTLAMLSNLELQ